MPPREPLLEESVEAMNARGNAQRAAGDLQGAVQSYQRSLEIAPDYTPSLYNLGLVLRELGRLDEAQRCFMRVTELDPEDAEALIHLGTLLQGASRFREAALAYRSALRLTPDNPYIWLSLAKSQSEMGETEDAMSHLRKSVALAPDYADAYVGLGELLADRGRYEEAAACNRDAIRLAPGHTGAHCNLGCTQLRLGEVEQALTSFRKAVELQPDFASAHFNLSVAYGLRQMHAESMASVETAMRLEPGNANFAEHALREAQFLCDWSRLDELGGLVRGAIDSPHARLISPFSLLYIPSTPAEQMRCAARFAASIDKAARADRERLAFRFSRESRARLRIGYMSADFRDHAVSRLAVELFELHDRRRFDLLAFSFGVDDSSALRARVVRAFDRFIEIGPLSHADAAAKIHAEGVDILVDLQGYTYHARTQILAMKPAPVQVNYLGYPATMGANFMDYVIVDRVIAGANDERYFVEAPVRMPGSYQANDRRRRVGAVAPRADLGLPQDAVVFCCFNQSFKILPDTFAAWLRILKAVPRGILWLLEPGPGAAANLAREASSAGVAPHRIVIAPLLSAESHLARLGAADLMLDTLPYNAHTTTSDALWVGLPVLTCAGESFPSRVAASLLTAAGIPELVTQSMREYENLAVHLALNPERLAALRRKIMENRDTSLLFDTPRYARDLERAYERMWENFATGKAPCAIDL